MGGGLRLRYRLFHEVCFGFNSVFVDLELKRLHSESRKHCL